MINLSRCEKAPHITGASMPNQARRRTRVHPAVVLIVVFLLLAEMFDFGDVLGRVSAGSVILPIAAIILLSADVAAAISLIDRVRFQR
jgi:hypothetical protein